MKVMERMGSYANQSFPYHPQKRMAMRLLEERGDQLQKTRQRQADFLAAYNLSTDATWAYDFKTLSAPQRQRHQRDHHRIRSAAPHHRAARRDSRSRRHRLVFEFRRASRRQDGSENRQGDRVLDSDSKTGLADGELGLETDRDGNLWFGMMFQGAVAKFDRETEKFQIFNCRPPNTTRT